MFEIIICVICALGIPTFMGVEIFLNWIEKRRDGK